MENYAIFEETTNKEEAYYVGDAMTLYLKDIAGISILSAKEEVELAKTMEIKIKEYNQDYYYSPINDFYYITSLNNTISSSVNRAVNTAISTRAASQSSNSSSGGFGGGFSSGGGSFGGGGGGGRF